MLLKKNITVTQTFPHYIPKRPLGVQNINEIEIVYVNEDDVESHIYN